MALIINIPDDDDKELFSIFKKPVKRKRIEKVEVEVEEEGPFNFVVYKSKSKSGAIIKDLPTKRDKNGAIVFFGYMDDYFKGQPPIASRNWVVDNETLQIVEDRTGQI
jgi:hypothetical protein